MEAGTDAPRFCLRADRTYDVDALRAWRARQGIKAVMTARIRCANPQPRDPKRYKARHAVEWGIGCLQRGQRVATGYAPYAQHGLDFLYLEAAWRRLDSKINAT